MWLLRFHIAFAILCWLTCIGFASFFRDCRINNGYIQKASFLVRILSFIKTFFYCLVPILNIFITVMIIVSCFAPKDKVEDWAKKKMEENKLSKKER